MRCKQLSRLLLRINIGGTTTTTAAATTTTLTNSAQIKINFVVKEVKNGEGEDEGLTRSISITLFEILSAWALDCF
jgi:hypothetical protein